LQPGSVWGDGWERPTLLTRRFAQRSSSPTGRPTKRERRGHPARKTRAAQAITRVDLQGEGTPDASPNWSDPVEILNAAIGSLRDDEIIAALSTATQMDPEELRDVRDPRAMAQRMSAIAMEDLIDTGKEKSGELAGVRFSKDGSGRALDSNQPDHSNDSNGNSSPQAPGERGPSRFSGKDSIRATFSTADYADRRVFMKWSRIDDPEVVLFRPYPVTPGARTSEVSLQPRSELPPGRYKVAFYSGDETMRPLASGLYTVVSPGEDTD